MLNDPSSSSADDVKALVVEKRPLEIVFSEEGFSPLRFVMPPYEDLAEVDVLKKAHFSLGEWTQTAQAPLWAKVSEDYRILVNKYHRFGKSPTFLNKLANLAAIEGNFSTEEEHLRKALSIKDDDFLRSSLVENLFARNNHAEAETTLLQMDLQRSLYANLRLAALHAYRKDTEGAHRHVSKAIEIDPLDFGARLFDGALKTWHGEYEQAIFSFRIAGEQRPHSSSVHTNLAIAYIRLNRKERALRSLKMAVAIDPLNLSATALLADVAHSISQDEDAIPSLQLALRFEQKQAGLWGRLARSLLAIGQTNEAIAAIRRQISVKDESVPWSNLGVAYHVRGDNRKALECFKHAISLSAHNTDYAYCVAAKNAALIVAKEYKPDAAVRFIESVVRPENQAVYASKPELSAIFISWLRSLVRLEHAEKAIQLGEFLLSFESSSSELVERLAISLITVYALQEGDKWRAIELAERFGERALARPRGDEVRSQLLNNVAFVYAEAGELDRAQHWLQLISDEVHNQAYPTATAGLIQFKKGHFERADSLYAEALKLAGSVEDKSRIRQKWNLEVAKNLLTSEPRKARRMLLRVIDEREGEGELVRQASSILRGLPPLL